MIQFQNGGRLVQESSELPDLRGARLLFGDFETSSGDPTKDSLNVWRDCAPCGFAVTADKHPGAWYVPWVVEGFYDWLRDTVQTAERWVNHNVKYDAHVFANQLDEDPLPQLVCTVTMGKLVNSDRLSYSLDALIRDWLDGESYERYERHERAMAPYLGKHNKDYGRIPYDIIGDYACEDVIGNRQLFEYCSAVLPGECSHIWNIEQAITRILYRMEREGMRVDVNELKATEYVVLNQLIQLEQWLHTKVGYTFRPAVSEDLYSVLCGTYGLPVLSWTETGNPSFDKDALSMYAVLPGAPKDVVKAIREYRELDTYRNFFLAPYQELALPDSDGLHALHPWYNQCVRTGRLSCKAPNMQQLKKIVKKLIRPRRGWRFLSYDASQIEFRVIVNYIRNHACIRAWAENPDTDFHQWVADEGGITRRPAKTLNFMMGYGGGKAKAVAAMAKNPDVIDDVTQRVEAMNLQPAEAEQVFNQLCLQRGAQLYEMYHRTLPTLKPTAREAANTARTRGYVRTLYGRHRHMPARISHKAFNSACQGSAADIVKDRMVAVQELLDAEYPDVKICAQVHDELVFTGPPESVENARDKITKVLETPSVDLDVPIRWSQGWSDRNWYEAVE